MGWLDKLKFWEDEDEGKSRKLPPRDSKLEGKKKTDKEICKKCGKKDKKDNLKQYGGCWYHKKCLRKAKKDAKKRLR